MAKRVGDTLLELCEADRELAIVLAKKEELITVRTQVLSEIDACRARVAAFEMQLESRAEQQAEDEVKLKEEQAKIIERRKALTDLGGAKSAKLVEREIDIAARSLQTLEERAIKSLDDVEEVKTSIESLRDELSELEQDFQATDKDRDNEINNLEKEANAVEKKREKLVGALTDGVKDLYVRVSQRYPATVVAIAQKHSCRVCNRYLPDQLYNQLQGDNYTVQCPGCSRILVYKES